MAKSKNKPAASVATPRVGIHIGISDKDRSTIAWMLRSLLEA